MTTDAELRRPTNTPRRGSRPKQSFTTQSRMDLRDMARRLIASADLVREVPFDDMQGIADSMDLMAEVATTSADTLPNDTIGLPRALRTQLEEAVALTLETSERTLATARSFARCEDCWDLHLELGRTIYCDACQRQHRVFHNLTPYLAVDDQRAARYGLTPAELQRLVNKANGRCEICTSLLTDRYAVDHNHETGEVRGVLCPRCNTALGQFGDDPMRLARAFVYLMDRGFYGMKEHG